MSWGVMMGLGQSLQQVGGMLLDNNKSKMRERLELERENRAVAREMEKEQRQLERELTTPTEWNPVQDDNGITMLQAFNKHGKPIQGETRPMSKFEAEEFARRQRMGELEVQGKEQTVANQSLEGILKGNQVRDYDSDKALDRRKDEASIESSLATAQAARSRAMADKDNGDTPPTNEQLATTLVKEYEDIIGQYAQSVDNPDGLTPSEVLQLANAAIAEAQKRKTNARTIFRDSLNIHAAKMPILRGK